jgi:hypothetical protein
MRGVFAGAAVGGALVYEGAEYINSRYAGADDNEGHKSN